VTKFEGTGQRTNYQSQCAHDKSEATKFVSRYRPRKTVLPPGLSDVHSQVLLLLHKARLAKPTSQGQKAALGVGTVTQPLKSCMLSRFQISSSL